MGQTRQEIVLNIPAKAIMVELPNRSSKSARGFLAGTLLLISGCGFMPSSELPTQCVVVVGQAEFKYGYIQGIKGEGTVLRIAEKGKGCAGKEIEVEKDGVKVRIGHKQDNPPE